MQNAYRFCVLILLTLAARAAARELRGPKTKLIATRGHTLFLFYRVDQMFRDPREFPPHAKIRHVCKSMDVDAYHAPEEIAVLERGRIGKCSLASLERYAAKVAARAASIEVEKAAATEGGNP